ncbi:helix-turn-helix domain-containing protein [Kallipyga massiliensis]|uniref:helix-turn-helix domain-containing protein n=1 Tax=Kallipyga massiliensis TaxID=1472764 RepID=UPI0004B6027C|nr:helix-turn-helix transcriptional regulator [Kallipyga massiliensis]
MKTGDIIKLFREHEGMCQTRLVEILNLSRSAVSMYESNNRVPSTYVLQDLSDIFNVDIDYLLGKTTKTAVLPERIGYENKQILFKDENFTLISPTRVMKPNAEGFLSSSLYIMTDEREAGEERPSREEILIWLRDHVRMAAFDGQNYEDRDDESLYRLYKELKAEAERD